jgi:hypothetical protein
MASDALHAALNKSLAFMDEARAVSVVLLSRRGAAHQSVRRAWFIVAGEEAGLVALAPDAAGVCLSICLSAQVNSWMQHTRKSKRWSRSGVGWGCGGTWSSRCATATRLRCGRCRGAFRRSLGASGVVGRSKGETCLLCKRHGLSQ